MPHDPPWESRKGCFFPSWSMVPPGAGLAERLALDDPHVQAVDPLDVGHLVLVALRGPLREQVVALGHVRVRIDHPQTLGQLQHHVPSSSIGAGGSRPAAAHHPSPAPIAHFQLKIENETSPVR